MAASMWIFKSTQPFFWRFPGAILGIVSVFLSYKLAENLFKDKKLSLLSALIFSLSGLPLVQARTGMNDIYLIFFSLASLIFLLKEKYFFSALFLGLALSSKWTGIYLFGLLMIIFFFQNGFKKLIRNKLHTIALFVTIPIIVYLATYIPFFLLGHDFKQFVELQQQMWGYHTNLVAAHDYGSSWWSWPFNLYPVWYYVEYFPNTISNIFATGNPILFWLGLAAVILTAKDYLKKRTFSLAVILLGYFISFLPWSISPRIMFLYHYTPTLPFLSLSLAYQIFKLKDKDKGLYYFLIGSIVFGFLIMYPFIAGIPLPKTLLSLFFLTNLTKNPF